MVAGKAGNQRVLIQLPLKLVLARARSCEQAGQPVTSVVHSTGCELGQRAQGMGAAPTRPGAPRPARSSDQHKGEKAPKTTSTF